MKTLSGKPFTLRDYQKDAAQVFYASGSEKGGSGKTVIGLATMALIQTKTLILTPNISASRQWIREICDKTNLTLDQVKEYSGEVKEIGPVTVATYQILTQRKRVKKGDEDKEVKEPEMTEEEVKKELANFPLFSEQKWGLMIYDEVHCSRLRRGRNALPHTLFRRPRGIRRHARSIAAGG